MISPRPLTFGAIDNTSLPLAVLAHGFPDTPFTWRYLGPYLAAHGYRVVAPWLPGYDAPTDKPISVGSYVRHLLDVRRQHDGDDRAVLVGHDWGAQAGYGVVAGQPRAFSRFVALAVPPVAALATGLFTHAQLKRSFYIYFIQQIGMAEVALIAPGFWESLWADWSPGYDAADDIAELRRHVTADNIANVVGPYRASLNPQFVDPDAEADTLATMQLPPVPTLYLHGADDGAIGADLLIDPGQHFPAEGSVAEIVDGVGHFLHLEKPEWVAARIGEWLGVEARTV